MKAIVTTDKRNDIDRKFDMMYNGMVAKAKLTPKQSQIVARYLREIMGMRLHEIESARDMGWMAALIEGEKFGTDVKRGAKRLVRVQQKCVDIINEAFGHECVDANGYWQSYDGCGLEHLQQRLARHGVEYDTAI
jgi:hypothetical protein